MAQLVLASRSPQRTALLTAAGIEHEVVPLDVEELDRGEPESVAAENARRKALAAARLSGAGALVLGADTVVALGDRLLPKPRDRDQGREWLRALSGATHRVLGGICLVAAGAGDAAGEIAGETVVSTEVRFRLLSERDIERYLDAGEWRERAGAYAVQGAGAALVASVEGDLTNVVGLALPAVVELLEHG